MRWCQNNRIKFFKKNAMQRCHALHLISLHFSDGFGLHLSDQLILLDSNALGSTLPDGRSCSDGSGALHLILTYRTSVCSTSVRSTYCTGVIALALVSLH